MNPKYQFILAVDFDGTITDANEFPYIGKLKEGAAEELTKLHDVGVIIILWTCREGIYLTEAVTYCRQHGVPIDYVNQNVPAIENAPDIDLFAKRKIFANKYVDDANIDGFSGWEAVSREVHKRLKSGRFLVGAPTPGVAK